MSNFSLNDKVNRVCLIAGLPGSGKSFLGNQLARQIGGLFLDDICRTSGTRRLKECFTSEMVIVADPSLCRLVNRLCAEKMVKEHHPDCEIEWVFFENAPDKCWANVQHRNDGRIVTKYTIQNLSRVYIIPEDAEVVEVWQK